QHDTDRQPILERNAPAPARLAARDEHLPRHVIPIEVLEVSEVRHVLSRSEVSRNVEDAGRMAPAPRRVDDEGRLPPTERGGGRQRLGVEDQLRRRSARSAWL